MRTWIGYAHPDRLLSYPDAAYLSGCCLPIRMLLTYPDVRYLSGCCLPIRMCDGGREPQSFTRTEPRLKRSGPRGRSQAWFLGNVARNSPAAVSNLESASLELQRFERRLKTDRGKLCATFIRRDPVAPSDPPAPSTRVARCVLLDQALCSLPYPLGLSG